MARNTAGRLVVILTSILGVLGAALARSGPPSQPSAPAYGADLNALLEHLDEKCQLLSQKDINWRAVSSEARKRLKAVDSDVQFYGLVSWVVDQLQDSHACVIPRDESLPAAWSSSLPKELQVPASFMPGAFDMVLVSQADEPMKTKGIEPGMVLDTIDDEPAHEWFERRSKERFEQGGFSTIHRARTTTYSFGVVLPEGGQARLGLRTLVLPDEVRQKYLGLSPKQRAAALKDPAAWHATSVTIEASECAPARFRGHGFPQWEVPNLVQVSADTSYATLPSGFGYVYLRQIDSTTQPAELKQAFAALLRCPGLVVDMRWNGGGGGEGEVAACFPGRGKCDDSSKWTKPAAVLIGPRVMSSGDSVAYFLKNTYRHQLFGDNTSGASGPKGSFELPSGFATVRYVCAQWQSRSLEGVGVAPNTPVLQDVVELSLGMDSVLAAAERHLKKIAK